MTAANETRGELDITLAGASYVMRPSFDAILAIEKQTGNGIFELARMADAANLPLADAAIVVTECVKAWGRATDNKSAAGFDLRRVGELIQESGIAIASKRIALLLFMASTGGYTSAGELMATREPQPPPAA